MPACIPHMAVARSAPSTMPPSPVARWRATAAAIPPANARPLSESPKAPVGMLIG